MAKITKKDLLAMNRERLERVADKMEVYYDSSYEKEEIVENILDEARSRALLKKQEQAALNAVSTPAEVEEAEEEVEEETTEEVVESVEEASPVSSMESITSSSVEKVPAQMDLDERESNIFSKDRVADNMFYKNLVNLEFKINLSDSDELSEMSTDELRQVQKEDVEPEILRLIKESKVSKKAIENASDSDKETFAAQYAKQQMEINDSYSKKISDLETILDEKELTLSNLKIAIKNKRKSIDEYLTNVVKNDKKVLQIEDKNSSSKAAPLTRQLVQETTENFKSEIAALKNQLLVVREEKEDVISQINQAKIDRDAELNDALVAFEKAILPIEISKIEAFSWIRDVLTTINRYSRDIKLMISLRSINVKKEQLSDSVEKVFEVAETVKAEFVLYDEINDLGVSIDDASIDGKTQIINLED